MTHSPPTPPPTMEDKLFHDTIRRYARMKWEDRGRPEGQDIDIWLEAEEELQSWLDSHHSMYGDAFMSLSLGMALLA